MGAERHADTREPGVLDFVSVGGAWVRSGRMQGGWVMKAFNALRRVGVLVGTCVSAGLLLLMASGAAARPACGVVSAGGSHDTLQAAVDAATSGDTLKVKGTCYGATTVDKSLTIVGRGQATLDGRNTGSVVKVDEGVTVAVTGLTITGGTGSEVSADLTCGDSNNYGGGILNLGSLTLARSTVTGNAALRGGGIENLAGSLVVTDSTVADNKHGGGIVNSTSRPQCELGGSLMIINSTVRDNAGGGIVNSGLLTLTNSTVADNSGVGIGNVGRPAVTNSTVSGNSGVGIESTGFFSGGGLTLTNSTVARNSRGGITSNHELLTLKNSSVTGNAGGRECCNTSYTVGGGIASFEDEVTLTNSTVTGNTAEYGGGMWNVFEAVTLTNSTVARNAARYGGGIADTNAPLRLILNGSSSVSRNRASVDGGGVWDEPPKLSAPDTRVILNDSSSVTGNTAFGSGGGIYNGNGELTLNNSASVTRNEASLHGGGIYNAFGATLSFGAGWAGTVSRNDPDDIFTE